MDIGSTFEILVWFAGGLRNSFEHWMNRICYRALQFWAALQNPQLQDNELELVKSILTTPQMHLFNKLQNSEKKHGIRVLKTLVGEGETNPDLITAALIHDIGKTVYPLRPWERVLVVLGKRFFPHLHKEWGKRKPKGLTRPFVVALNHSQWGAELARIAGTNPMVITLIREHETVSESNDPQFLKNHLLHTLQKADNQN